jgi:hypothetical protein
VFLLLCYILPSEIVSGCWNAIYKSEIMEGTKPGGVNLVEIFNKHIYLRFIAYVA